MNDGNGGRIFTSPLGLRPYYPKKMGRALAISPTFLPRGGSKVVTPSNPPGRMHLYP